MIDYTFRNCYKARILTLKENDEFELTQPNNGIGLRVVRMKNEYQLYEIDYDFDFVVIYDYFSLTDIDKLLDTIFHLSYVYEI